LPALLVSALAGAASATLVGASVWQYQRKQNVSHAMGGPISPAKSYWLGFAIFAWFFLPLCLLLPEKHSPGIEVLLATFCASMWTRGLLEMALLYKWKLWKPPMGIGHDIFCQAVLLIQAGFYWPEIVAARGQDLALVAFCVWLFVSLCFEIYYAAAFYKAVKGLTTGEDGIWFADDDPRFRRILTVTRFGNVALSGSLAGILVSYAALR
jgi:hypothetical protein